MAARLLDKDCVEGLHFRLSCIYLNTNVSFGGEISETNPFGNKIEIKTKIGVSWGIGQSHFGVYTSS